VNGTFAKYLHLLEIESTPQFNTLPIKPELPTLVTLPERLPIRSKSRSIGNSCSTSGSSTLFSSLDNTVRTTPITNTSPNPGTPPEIEALKSNLYVSGIPPGWTRENLLSKFTKYGEILSCKLWYNTDVGVALNGNAGTGFVQFRNRENAQKAIDELNGEHEGKMLRPLLVKFANAPSFQNKSAPMGSRTNIYVSGLPTNFNDEKLCNLFSTFGEIHSVLVLPKKTNYKKCTGFVKFQSKLDALNALKVMHRHQIPDTHCTISCSWAKEKQAPNLMNTTHIADTRTNIYVTGIDTSWTDECVKDYFKVFGPIKSVALREPRMSKFNSSTNSSMRNSTCATPKPELVIDGNITSNSVSGKTSACNAGLGYPTMSTPKDEEDISLVAFVQFIQPESAILAINSVHGSRVPGQKRPLSVRFSKHQHL